MSYSRAIEMRLTPIRHPNQCIVEPDELDTAALIHTRAAPAPWSPSHLYASPTEMQWYDPWTHAPLHKQHAAVPESTAFASPHYDPYLATGVAHVERKRSGSCFSLSGLSTPGLSWRDSSCSPYSFTDDPGCQPVSNAEAMCFSAAAASSSQLLTSSPHYSPTSQPLFYAFPGAQNQSCSAYAPPPQPTFELPTTDEILACAEHWPDVLLQEPFSAPEAVPTAPPHMPQSHHGTDSPRELPELQHPKPWRPYVPPWQTATDFDLAEFVPPQSASQDSSVASPEDASSCQAGPSWALPSVDQPAPMAHVEEADEEDEEDEDGCTSEDEVEELMDLWAPEDQGVFAQQQSPAHHPYAGGLTVSRFGAATFPPIPRNVPHQVLPPDSLLYQPIHWSAASNWTSADPNSYSYTHCS